MSEEQQTIDVVEFILNNKDDLNHWINEQTSHLTVCERIFDSCPEMFDELLERARMTKLREFLQSHFCGITADRFSLILEHPSVKMSLQS